MPLIRVKYSSKAKLYEREFNCEFRVTPKDKLFCILCMSKVTCEKRQQVERYRATMKHVSAKGAIEDQNKKVTLTQQLLPVVSKDFMAELVKTFLAADIPLHKLRNPHVIQLFENRYQKKPSETVCRDYVKTLANNEQDRNLPMLLWETLMSQRKCISSSAMLLKLWTKASSAWMTLRKLDIARENFLLLLSDAASYMTACTA